MEKLILEILERQGATELQKEKTLTALNSMSWTQKSNLKRALLNQF